MASDVDRPRASSKKGLQAQMAEDAVALRIAHAAVNVDLVALVASRDAAQAIEFARGDQIFRFDAGYVAQLDAQIRPLAQAGIILSLILLDILGPDEAKNRAMLDPRRADAPPNRICAPNVLDREGRALHAACVAFLAHRYGPSRRGGAGAAWNWICGNEVNSHWWWMNMGRASLEDVADLYESFVRIVHDEVTAHHPGARAFVSLEHHWSVRYSAGEATQAFPGRDFLLRFAALARERGDFAWQVAFHPYPEDLFDCAFWDDVSAPDQDDAARVTFKNLPVLARFLAREDSLHAGESRRVLLSEQGFHRRDGDDGERLQAAAFAAAWVATQREPGIDAMILHRHVDHAHEGGLQLGLWTRAPNSVCDPDRPTQMRRAFAACDGPQAEAELSFALPILGIASWAELPARLGHRVPSMSPR